MTVEEYKAAFRGLSQSQVREKARTDSVFRSETERIYVGALHNTLNKSCGDCWCDAYAVIMLTKTETIMKSAERKFALAAGALLRDVRQDCNARLCTHHNLTDELALYHLGTCPAYIKYFTLYPENWQQLASEYIAKLDGKAAESASSEAAEQSATESAKAAPKARKTAKTRS